MSWGSVVEDGPHTGAMKGSVIDRTRDNLMTFAAALVYVRFGRRKAVFAAGRLRLLQTPTTSWRYVVACRVFRLRRLWMWLNQLSWKCGGFCGNVSEGGSVVNNATIGGNKRL